MEVMTCVAEAGANGKFSGGFDITAFGGLQGGKSNFGTCYLILYSMSTCVSLFTDLFIFLFTVEMQKPGHVSTEILSDTVEGTAWNIFFS